MEPQAIVTLTVPLVMLSLLCAYVAYAAGNGSLEANSAVGLRTKATKSSNAAWRQGHQAARPLMLAAAITGMVGAITTLSLLLVDPESLSEGPTGLMIPGAALLATLALLISSGIQADRKAKDVLRHDN